MIDEEEKGAAHVLLRQDEITQDLVGGILRRQGIDPAHHTAQSKVIYRIIEGRLFASVVVERVDPHPTSNG